MDEINHIAWDTMGSIGILTIHNPPENYIAEPEFVPLEALSRWTENPELKGILVKGEGRHFSAGGDLDHLFRRTKSAADIETLMNSGKKALLHLRSLRIPLVAAVSGVCFGAGLEIALACHIRICSDSALFAFPEAGHNIIPGYGGTHFSSRSIPVPKAMEMILSGEILNADEALKTGLVNYITGKQEVVPKAMALLKKMTDERHKEVINAIIEAMENNEILPAGDALRRETELFADLAHKEAIRRGFHQDHP